jgi:hypothetical protein
MSDLYIYWGGYITEIYWVIHNIILTAHLYNAPSKITDRFLRVV